MRRDHTNEQGRGVAVCYREDLQLQQLSVSAPEEMEAKFFRLFLTCKTAVLLCALYRPNWQGGAPLTFLTGQLDAIMATHDCQNTVIVGDLNQHLVHSAFTELTVVQGLTNHVNFATHIHGVSLDPVLTNLPSDSVQCYQLNQVDSSDHNVVLCELGINIAYEKGSQSTIWLWWDRTDWRIIKQILAITNWTSTLAEDMDKNVAAFTSTILSV